VTALAPEIFPQPEEVDAVKSATHYEQDIDPDEPERSARLTDDEQQQISQRLETEDSSQVRLEQQPNERAAVFNPPSEWVHPKVKYQQSQAMMLPNPGAIGDLDKRIAAVARFDAMPEEVAKAAQAAREGVQEAREVYRSAQHPERPRYARSQQAKDDATVALADATRKVSALEHTARRDDIQQAWLDTLVSGLDEQREATVKAVRAAEKAYAAYRAAVGGANALAIEQGRWDSSWHQGTVYEHTLNAPIQSMRDAIAFLESADDWESGRFLTEEYEGVPPHTLAKLKRSADLAGGGTFQQQIFVRAVKPSVNDKDAVEAVRTKRLSLLTSSNPFTETLMGRREEEG
jgi:hypothetical protein